MHSIDQFWPEAATICLGFIMVAFASAAIERLQRRVHWCRWFGSQCPHDGRCPRWLKHCEGV